MAARTRSPLVGRYQVLHALWSSPESQVFLAEDLQRGGKRCALKIARVADSGAFARAQRVFSLLRKLRHPGVAEVYDFGRLDPRELEAGGVKLSDARGKSRDAADLYPLGMGWLARRRTIGVEEPLAYVASVYYQGLSLRDAFVLLFPPRSAPEHPLAPPRARSGAEGNGRAEGSVETAAESGGNEGPRPVLSEDSPIPPIRSEHGRAPWTIFLEAVARIFEALEAIHSRGLIHYDLKPENILLVPEPLASRPQRFAVKILDFGLSERETTPVGTRVRGTVPFLAPELLDSASTDRRSDLFSLGVTLAVAIAGRMPFPGSGPKEWLKAARAGERYSLDNLCQDLPPGLSALVDGLLEPDPSRRPPTARSVIPILEQMGRFALAPQTREPAPYYPTVGWERELALVRAEIEHMKRGEAERALVILEGDSEQFLDRIADEVETMAHVEGVRVEGGRCRLPRRFAYQPFGQILCKLLRQGPPDAARCARLGGVLSSFCPGLGNRTEVPTSQVPAEGRESPPPPKALPPLAKRLELYRFLDVVTEFFMELGQETPLVICLRDLHSAGRETLDLIRSLSRNVHLRSRRRREPEAEPSAEPVPILIVATLRSTDAATEEESEASANQTCLNEIVAEPYTLRLPLRNLALDELRGWLLERVPQVRLDGEALRRLHEKSRGSVAFLEEYVRRIPGIEPKEGPVSSAGAEPFSRPDLPQSPLSASPHILLSLPRKAVDAALERIQHLPAPERRLLEILSVAGGTLSFEEIAAACPEAESLCSPPPSLHPDTGPGRGEPSLEPALLGHLERLEDLGFIVIHEDVGGVHASVLLPQLARRIYVLMPEDLRVSIHRTMATVLAAGARPQESARAPEDIAFHALLGGSRDLFIEQALLAAQRLSAAHAMDAAAQLYERILEQLGADALPGDRNGAPAGGPATWRRVEPARVEALRAQISEKLAEIYLESGQLQKAIEKLTILSSAQEALADPVTLGSVYRRMGEAFQQSEEAANAAFFLEKSWKTLRLPLEAAQGELASEAGGSGGAACERARILKELQLTLLALSRLQASKENLEEAARSLDLCLGEATDQPEILCQAHILFAEIQQKRGLHTESLASYLEALEVARDRGSPPLYLEVLSTVGSSYIAQGQYDKAVECFERALEAARALNSKFDMSVCYRKLGTIYHNRADHERALEHFQRSLLLSSQIGDLKGIAQSYNNLGIVHRLKDDLTQAAECYRFAIDLFSRINDHQGMAAGMNNLATILELEGKYDEALEYSFRALDKRKKARSRSGMAFSYYGIGKIYQSKGEVEKAITFAEKSLQIRREIGERLGIAYSSLLLSELSLAQEKYQESMDLCQQALRDFASIENEVGALLVRGALGRILFTLGEIGEAGRTLQEVLVRARETDQHMLVGNCLLSLSRIAIERGSLREAEDFLAEAEKLFRSGQNRRELAAVLLAQAALTLESQQLERTSEALEAAYSILEELAVRDLVPEYFLLRGRLEMDSTAGDLEAARNFLERGLMEAREMGLPESRARFQHIIGILEMRRGDTRLAGIHFQEARSILDEFFKGLPPDLRENFYRLREREEIRTSLSKLPDSKQAVEPSGSRKDGEKPLLKTPAEGHRTDELLTVHRQTLKLHEVAAAMGSEPNLRKLLETIMDAVLEIVDAERGFLILKGTESDARTSTVARNLDREDILSPERKVSDSVSKQVLRTGKPMLVRNALDDRRFLTSKSVRDLRLRSLICVPLRFRGQTLGIIYLDNRHRRDAFSEGDLNILQAFADQASVAVTNARLIDENRRRNAELQEASRKTEALNQKLRRKVHRRTAQLALARDDLRQRQSQLEDRYRFGNILGRSEAMQEVFYLLEKVAATQLPVLIEGESGTGKDLVAKAIHFNSLQKEGRFVSESCGALTESLFETELFGHVRGAFTGAVSEKKGLLELADKGSLFLDDVDDLSLAMQQKLLRFLEEKEIRRVGGKETVRVDVRIIAASGKDLSFLVRDGLFRGDLYYRLNGVRIRLPSLRERKEDIPLLVDFFLKDATATSGGPARSFHPDAIRSLMDHDWPGNVRELRHLVERALLVAPEPVVRREDIVFDPSFGERLGGALPGSASGRPEHAGPGATGDSLGRESCISLQEARNHAERDYLLACLRETEGNVAQAARACRVSRESFYRLLRKHRLKP